MRSQQRQDAPFAARNPVAALAQADHRGTGHRDQAHQPVVQQVVEGLRIAQAHDGPKEARSSGTSPGMVDFIN
jgi:hypothetical protein